MITVSEQTELDNFELRRSMDQEKQMLSACIQAMLHNSTVKEIVGYAVMYWEGKLDDSSQDHLKQEIIEKWRPIVLEASNVGEEAPKSK